MTDFYTSRVIPFCERLMNGPFGVRNYLQWLRSIVFKDLLLGKLSTLKVDKSFYEVQVKERES
jgi:hypothetical protein